MPHVAVGFLAEAELGPVAGDDALHDPVADGVALAHADRGVAELTEQDEVFVVPTVGDVLAVEMERTHEPPVLVSLPFAVAHGLEEEARVAGSLDLDRALLA